MQRHCDDENQPYVEQLQGRGTRHPDKARHHAEEQTHGICRHQLMPFNQLWNRRRANGVQNPRRQQQQSEDNESKDGSLRHRCPDGAEGEYGTNHLTTHQKVLTRKAIGDEPGQWAHEQ